MNFISSLDRNIPDTTNQYFITLVGKSLQRPKKGLFA